jgi:hypothetical protein
MVAKSAFRRGRFGLSLGVGREDGPSTVAAAGADVKVTDVCIRRFLANSTARVN